MTAKELNKIIKDHALWLENKGGKKADLRKANLRGAQLQWADLRGAQLQWADLRWAKLRWAQLQGAQLQGANLSGAWLQGADLQGVVADEETSGFWSVCPEEGSFIAFKKLKDDKIAKILIPEHAKRSSATTRKCRCSEALVVEIKDRNGNNVGEGFSKQADRSGCKLLYKVGQTVFPDSFDEERWNECSNGIHFFMTRREAELY